MKRRIVLLSVIVGIVTSVLASSCLGQRRGSRAQSEQYRRMREFERRSEQRRLESQRRREEHQKISREYRGEAHQEALGITAEQWAQIEPLMRRIDALRVGPMLKFSTYGFSSGGSSSSQSSVRMGSSRSGGSGPGSGGGSAGWSAGRGGSGGSGSSGSVRYGFGSGSGPRPPRPGGGGSGGGAGVGPEQPVKKRVGELNLGWTWRRPSESKDAASLTEGEKVCEGLLDAIEAKDPDPSAVKEHIEKLRRLREQAKRDLEEARRQLREVVNAEQEAKLILMGYLD
jgi:hypothetical protein